MPRPLIQLGSTGDDVVELKHRLNLSGAHPQLMPHDSFDDDTDGAVRTFQANHGLTVDGDVGDDTWPLLDQLDGGRLLTALDVAGVQRTRDAARELLRAGDFATAKSQLDVEYAKPGLPPEERSSVAALLSWAEHGLSNWERARDLLVEAALIVELLPTPLVTRDIIHRLREINLRQPPGPLPSYQNVDLLPPNG
jgi:hypothetical protein